MKFIDILNNLLFFFFTWGVCSVYYFKIVFNKVIFYSLTFITASTAIDGNNELEKGYICLSVLIVVLLTFEDFKRRESPYFSMIDCITQPMNAAVGIKRTIPYRRYKHTFSTLGFLMIEILKILSAIYCIIVLSLENTVGLVINYIMFAMLLFESSLGLYIHIISTFCLLAHKRFFKKWLKWMCKWYFSGIMKSNVRYDGTFLTIEVRDLKDNDSDPSPVKIIEDLRNSSS